MKELTIEQKAKAYNEALKKAKECHIDGLSLHQPVKDVIEYIFPELKESEDEKIRKTITAVIGCYDSENSYFKEVSKKKCLVWLEKQGEQKLTDNVEPKFKVGDYVVGKYISGYITEVRDNCYLLDYQGFSIDKQDNYHLWTIQDAKDGDVLVDSLGNICIYQEPSTKLMYHSYCYGNHKCFIDMGGSHEIVGSSPATKEQHNLLFQKMKEEGYEWDAEKKELKKIEQNTDEYIEVKGLSEIESEADELIKEMSGEKHNLTDFERTLTDICIGWIGEEPGWEQYIKDNADVLLKIAIKKFNSVQDAPFEQKPAWSEEDNIILSRIIADYERSNEEWFNAQKSLPHGRKITWLKSLKDRVQPKQEWSEEDKEFINDLIGIFDGQQYQAHSDEEIVKWLKSIRLPYNKEWDENDEEMLKSIIATCELACEDRDSSLARHLLQMQTDWLKSLRLQNTWKPSEEQMAQLQKYCPDNRPLTLLYEQLKKLKG